MLTRNTDEPEKKMSALELNLLLTGFASGCLTTWAIADAFGRRRGKK